MFVQLFFHQTFIEGLRMPGLVLGREDGDKSDTTKGYGLTKAPIEVKRDLNFQKSRITEYLLAGKRNKCVGKKLHSVIQLAHGYLTFKDVQSSKAKLRSGELRSIH